MTKLLIHWTNTLTKIILSLTLLASITLCIHVSPKKMLIPPKPLSYPIQNYLHCTVFHFNIRTNFLLNPVSYTQLCATEPCSNISVISPNHLLSVIKFTNSIPRWYGDWMMVWLGLYLTLVLLFVGFSFWKVSILSI